MKTLKTPGCHSEKPLAGFSKRKELRSKPRAFVDHVTEAFREQDLARRFLVLVSERMIRAA